VQARLRWLIRHAIAAVGDGIAERARTGRVGADWEARLFALFWPAVRGWPIGPLPAPSIARLWMNAQLWMNLAHSSIRRP